MLLVLTSFLSLLGWVTVYPTVRRVQTERNHIYNKIKGRVSVHHNTHILITIIVTSVRNKEPDVFVLVLGGGMEGGRKEE